MWPLDSLEVVETRRRRRRSLHTSFDHHAGATTRRRGGRQAHCPRLPPGPAAPASRRNPLNRALIDRMPGAPLSIDGRGKAAAPRWLDDSTATLHACMPLPPRPLLFTKPNTFTQIHVHTHTHIQGTAPAAGKHVAAAGSRGPFGRLFRCGCRDAGDCPAGVRLRLRQAGRP